MASTYPAEFLRMDDTRGRIKEGLRADLVLVDEAMQVRGTWIDGIPG
jgi:N-acetylglucosamine-6-phosphate deacetylase